MEDYYSSKFQFHVIELSKIETTKGNHYMEKARGAEGSRHDFEPLPAV